MIYLFDRLYLESDQYIRNDQKKLTALLGPVVDQINNDPLMASDFGPIQLDREVENENLAEYLQNLVVTADGRRATIFTTDDMIIKVLSFWCSCIFKNPSKEFVKELILLDKMWIDQAAGISGHRDLSLRHKGTPILDITNIDALIEEGMSITPKITQFNSLRIEYLYPSYITNTLPSNLKTYLEDTVKAVFYDSNWLGQLVKTFSPLILTVAANDGVNLDTFTIEDLKANRPEYYTIYDTAIIGDETCFDRVTLNDWLSFFNRASQDFGWNVKPNIIQFFTEFYNNKIEFIKQTCLTPANAYNWYCLVDLGKTIKINPHLWYYIAREHENTNFLNNFELKSHE
jgi:hypothetical protein